MDEEYARGATAVMVRWNNEARLLAEGRLQSARAHINNIELENEKLKEELLKLNQERIVNRDS